MTEAITGEVPRGPDPRLSLAVALGAGLLFVILAAVLVPWHWLPGGHVHAVPADSVFSAAQIARAEHVSGLLRYTSWAGLAISLVVAVLLGGTRLGARLVERIPGPWLVRAFLAVGAVTLIGSLATLVPDWRIQQVERSYGLSTEAWGSWLGDEALGAAISWVFAGIAVVVLMAIARRAPRTWPVWGATAAMVLAVGGSFVYPVLVEPLFNSFTSMPAGPLRTDIMRLAAIEHVHIGDVLVADASRRTTELNAYVSGFGSTRRVVVYDTMIRDLPRAQIDVVVAHELGHARHQDVLVGTLLGAVSPIQNTISRAIEARADRASLEATGETATFVAMQRQLALHALADPTPPWLSQFWFGTHPTVLQRIGLAEQLQGR